MTGTRKNEYAKWAIWIVSIVFLAGAAFATIHFNSLNIESNSAGIKENSIEINNLAITVGKIDIMEIRQQTMSDDLALIKQAVIQ